MYYLKTQLYMICIQMTEILLIQSLKKTERHGNVLPVSQIAYPILN